MVLSSGHSLLHMFVAFLVGMIKHAWRVRTVSNVKCQLIARPWDVKQGKCIAIFDS